MNARTRTPARQARAAARLAAVQALYQHEMEATPQAKLLDEFTVTGSARKSTMTSMPTRKPYFLTTW